MINKLFRRFIVLNFIFNIVTAKDKGIELFNDKKFAEAVDYYKTVLEARKDDPSAMFSLGSSSYYNNDIESALKSFENILYTSDKALQSKALYNIARIMQDQNEIDKSLSLYKKSLELNPNDIDSKINYEFLKKMLKQDQQNAENQEGKQDQQNAENQENKTREQGEKEDLENRVNKEDQMEKEKTDQMMQAEAILNAIKGKEKINQKHKILKSKTYKYDKDW